MAKKKTENIIEESKVDEKVEVVEIPSVEIPFDELPPVTEEKKKPARKKAKKKKTAVENVVGVNDISMLIQSMFSLVALKGGQHWNIDQSEADLVAKPLSNILTKMNLLEKVSNVSDGVALVVGCATITLPRIMITQQINQSRKVEKINAIREQTTTPSKEIESCDPSENSNEHNPRSEQNKSNDGEFIKNISNTAFEQPY